MSEETNNDADVVLEISDDQVIQSGVPAKPHDVLPDKLYLLPISERPFFPAQTLPIITNAEQWHDTVERINNTPHHYAGIILVDGDPNLMPEQQHFHKMGSVVRVHQGQMLSGQIQFIAEGIRRFRIIRWISKKAPFLVQVEYPEPGLSHKQEIKAYAMAIIRNIKELMNLNPLYKEQLRMFLERFSPDEASPLTDFAAIITSAEKQELQDILETVELLPRMEKVLVLLRKELEMAQVQMEIQQRVHAQMDNQQREFFLREQLKAIQKELGISKDDKTVEMDRFNERLESLELPEPVQKRIDDEMQKFSFLELGSPEYAVTRNYLDVITLLPWGKHSKDKLDLTFARDVLDKDHSGLNDIKDRIIEFLAVGVIKGEVGGAILLLVGPPGVGKTSIGRSIAKALDRQFYRFSLGGMRDEAEIKGHRRTYIGAMPGKFIQAIKECGTANPVIMLDEIDKIGSSYQGDPASALLEVLDPEQNTGFLDHYLDVRFDLSNALFVCTANQLDTIPGPLLDRMEIIRLGGYISSEKVQIAKQHLWPKQLKKAGLKKSDIKISDAALKKVAESYAREAGVRNLEKQLGRIIRKAIVEILDGAKKPVRIGHTELENYLGPVIFRKEKPMRGVGVVTGLAWTAMGGATLPVEAKVVHRHQRGFKLTGKLGDVMKESAEIAYSYMVAHASEYGADESFFDKAFIHVHVPEGATPKDGPSAGVTIATALLSLAYGKRLPRLLAMTGELTLTGQVLPVGGIREKIIAAKRANIKELLLPEANRRDFDELPEHIQTGMTVHFVEEYPQAQSVIFNKNK